MKITFIAPYMSGRGGTETVVSSVLNNLISHYNDLKVTLLLTEKTRDKTWINYLDNRIHIIYPKIENKLTKAFSLFSYVARKNPDLVIILGANIIPYVEKLRKIFRKKFKILSWIQISLFTKKIPNPQNVTYADYHLAISSGIKQQLKSLSVPESKIFTIYDPVKPTKATIIRSRKSQKNKNKKLLYIGRIEFKEQKNIKELLDALSLVHGNWFLDIFGSGKDLKKCQEYAKKNNINNKIKWHGWADRPWEQIKEADVLLLTSTYEGFGMVLAEAISRGLPCISSNCPVGPNDIINKNNGFLYSPGNKKQLASSIQKIVNGYTFGSIESIKSSISELYEKNYFNRFFKDLDKITNH